ncbi:LytR/AlgR family response regulator transcription factor [Cohnella soli]|uniref:LytR/AlgR family response regulator transcription factor n=1 Tax=Cohnella soli TaxID=425005 RepID=A0ABW0HMW5_9BACL
MKRDLTVIIAEDSEFDRLKLEAYAGQLGLKVVSSVGSGEWLVEDALQYQPDLVFLDIGLNGTDGLTAYRTILEKGLSPYLIMVSGTNDPTLILAGVAMNCIDFVTKPITFMRLQEAVGKAKVFLEKDLHFSKAVPGKIIQVKSNYRNVFINENKLIYAQKLKGEHKTVIYVEGEKQTGIETTASISEIFSQCSESIYSPNQSNLINVNYIKKVFPSDRLFGTYIIQLDYRDIEIDLTRRKRKEFEILYSKISKAN